MAAHKLRKLHIFHVPSLCKSIENIFCKCSFIWLLAKYQRYHTHGSMSTYYGCERICFPSELTIASTIKYLYMFEFLKLAGLFHFCEKYEPTRLSSRLGEMCLKICELLHDHVSYNLCLTGFLQHKDPAPHPLNPNLMSLHLVKTTKNSRPFNYSLFLIQNIHCLSRPNNNSKARKSWNLKP